MKGGRTGLEIAGICLCLATFTLGIPNVSWSQNSSGQPLIVPESPEYFDSMYKDFYNNYRLGPADEIAIRVVGQPDYSLDKVKISPTGRIYHPLIGDMTVAGYTVNLLTQKLTTDFADYVINPKVNVELLVAQSSKIGVLGEVLRPGIVVMTGPMTILDVISASGGVSDSGNKSSATLLRQYSDGKLRTINVNLKRILEGKADPDENLTLRAGDTIIIHGNLKKKLSNITAFAGFTQFMAFLTLAGH